MNAIFLDHQDSASSYNGKVVTKAQEALTVLRSLQTHEPRFCSLESEAATLLIGVANGLGCTQFSVSGASPPYLMAVARPDSEHDDYISFLSGGTPSPISSRYLLSWDLVERIVSYFMSHGRRIPDVVWEEI